MTEVTNWDYEWQNKLSILVAEIAFELGIRGVPLPKDCSPLELMKKELGLNKSRGELRWEPGVTKAPKASGNVARDEERFVPFKLDLLKPKKKE